MNATTLAYRTYSGNEGATRTARGTEYAVIARVTHRLKAAASRGSRDFPGLAAAVAENRRLWATLAADVATGGNTLPDELRARIFWLSEFTEIHSRQVLGGRASVAPLLEVNTAVLRGLRREEPQP